jgi:hypothetical protein
MQMEILHNPIPAEIPLDNGILRLLPSDAYDAIDPVGLRAWCQVNARYGLPTIELIRWLQDYIGDRTAIEIGSGHGDLAFHLGIPATDNRQQERPDVVRLYTALRQPLIKYPVWVKNLDALDAVDMYKPDVVVASWVTHWIDPDLPMPAGGGNMYGVKEDKLLETGVTYIVIGNEAVHSHKPIMALPHETHHFPFIRSRAKDPSLNRLWIWNR